MHRKLENPKRKSQKSVETEKPERLKKRKTPSPPHSTLSRSVALSFCGHNILATLSEFRVPHDTYLTIEVI